MIAMVVIVPVAIGAAGWWLRGAAGAAIGAAAGAIVAGGVAWIRSRAPSVPRIGTGTMEMKPGVVSGGDTRTRTAVMDGGTRVGVVPAGRSARGHRDRDL